MPFPGAYSGSAKAAAEKGEEHHSCDTECAVAEVHCKKGRDRRQSRLRGEQPRLKRVARDERAEVERKQNDRPGRKAKQQCDKRPRHKRRSRAKDGQRVEQCDEEGEQQGIALTNEKKARQKF